jgi:hypothetical protein
MPEQCMSASSMQNNVNDTCEERFIEILTTFKVRSLHDWGHIHVRFLRFLTEALRHKGDDKSRSHASPCLRGSLRDQFFDRTTSVTGPPPIDFYSKTCVIGGSCLPLGSTKAHETYQGNINCHVAASSRSRDGPARTTILADCRRRGTCRVWQALPGIAKCSERRR